MEMEVGIRQLLWIVDEVKANDRVKGAEQGSAGAVPLLLLTSAHLHAHRKSGDLYRRSWAARDSSELVRRGPTRP